MDATAALLHGRFLDLNRQRLDRLRALLKEPARSAFDAIATELHPLDSVLGVYAMGSAGTLGHGPESDLDVWIVTDAPGHPRLRHTAEQISEQCTAAGIDLRTFLVQPNELKLGQRQLLHGDDCGTTQHRLLLDEFYRTAVHLSGATPLWWAQSPRAATHEPGLLLDFGDVSGIPHDEILGATLWHLNKALDSPQKSMLKLLLLEAYAVEGGQPLAIAFKDAVIAGGTDLDQLDPYRMLYQRIESYLQQRGDTSRLEFARLCLYRKTGVRLSRANAAGSWQRESLTQLVSTWGWDPAHVAWLDARSRSSDGVLSEHREIARQLDFSHALLRQLVAESPYRFANDRDLRLLEARLTAATLQWPGKLMRLSPSLARQLVDRIAESPVRLIRHKALWSLRTADGSNLLQSESLLEVLAWGVLNRLFESHHETGAQHAVLPEEAKYLLPLLRYALAMPAPTPGQPQPSGDDGDEPLLLPARPDRETWFVVDASPWQIERLAVNSWGEVSLRSYGGERALARLLETGLHEGQVHCVPIHPRHLPQAAELQRLHGAATETPATPLGERMLLQNGDGFITVLLSAQSKAQEFADLDALFDHLNGHPLPTQIRGRAPTGQPDPLAPYRLLEAHWRQNSGDGAATVLLGDATNKPCLAYIDRDGAFGRVRLPERPTRFLHSGLRAFVSNLGRRLGIPIALFHHTDALKLIAGPIYLPERLQVTVHETAEGYRLDAEFAERNFENIGKSRRQASALRDRVLGMRRTDQDYPITVSDVVLSDPTRWFLRDLLRIKNEVEDLLNN